MRKIFLPCLILLHSVLPQLQSAQKGVLFLKGGASESGTISMSATGSISLAKSLEHGEVIANYELDAVDRIEFVLSDEETKSLEDPHAVPEAVLAGLWKKLSPFAGKVRSQAERAGSNYTAHLLESTDADKMALGIKLLGQLREMELIDSGIVRRLQFLRVEAALLQGDLEEARKLQAEFPEFEGTDTPEMAEMSVRMRIAEARLAEKELGDLEEEWPKWELMPEKIEERRKLIDRSLRGYLYGVAFHPESDVSTAAGLWAAAGLYEKIQQPDEAKARAEDIVSFFPVAPYVDHATALLEKHSTENPNEPPQQ